MKPRTLRILLGFVLVTALPVVLALSFVDGPDGGVLAGILGALCATFYVLGVVLVNVLRKKAVDVPLLPGEEVTFTIPANHMDGLVSYGGHLRVSNERLVFLPHRFNARVMPVTIAWAEVDQVSLGDTADLVFLKYAAKALRSGEVVKSSTVLRVQHGGAESRFVVLPNEELLAFMVGAAKAARLA